MLLRQKEEKKRNIQSRRKLSPPCRRLLTELHGWASVTQLPLLSCCSCLRGRGESGTSISFKPTVVFARLVIWQDKLLYYRRGAAILALPDHRVKGPGPGIDTVEKRLRMYYRAHTCLAPMPLDTRLVYPAKDTETPGERSKRKGVGVCEKSKETTSHESCSPRPGGLEPARITGGRPAACLQPVHRWQAMSGWFEGSPTHVSSTARRPHGAPGHDKCAPGRDKCALLTTAYSVIMQVSETYAAMG